jgi:hypothetical protein
LVLLPELYGLHALPSYDTVQVERIHDRNQTRTFVGFRETWSDPFGLAIN